MPLDLRNPVIEGYLSGLAIKRQREQDEIANALKQQESARQDAELKIREQQFQSYLKHLDFEEKHANSQLDLQKQTLAQEKAFKTMEAQRSLYKMAAEGDIQAGPGQLQNQGNVGAQFQIGEGSDQLPQIQTRMMPGAGPGPSKMFSPGEIRLGDISLQPDQVVSAEDAFARKLSQEKQMNPVLAERAGSIAGEQAKATDPYERGQKVLASTLRMGENAQEARYDREKWEANITFQQLEGQKDRANRMAIAKLQNAGMLASSPGIIASAQDYYDGNASKPLGTTRADQAINQVLKMQDPDAVPTTTATTNAVRATKEVDPVVKKMQALIGTLPDDAFGANWNAFLSSRAGKLFKTELGNLATEFESVSEVIGRNVLDMKGVFTDKDSDKVLKLISVAGLPKDQAIERIGFFQSLRNGKVINSKLGNLKPKQQLNVLIKQGMDPTQYTIDTIDGLKPLYVQSSTTQEWGYYDKASGKYKPIFPKKEVQ